MINFIKKFWWVLGIIILIIFYKIGTKLYSDYKGQGVTFEKIERKTIESTIMSSGKIYPETELSIKASSSGVITKLWVQEGETVKKGMPLITITSENSGGGGMSILVPSGSSEGSKTIYSTIDGMITGVRVKEGERVSGNGFTDGNELMKIGDYTKWILKIDVSENEIIKLNIGDTAKAFVDAYKNEIFKGTVYQITNNNATNNIAGMSIGGGSDITNYKVSIRLDENSFKKLFETSKLPFRSGMSGSAEILIDKKENIIAAPILSVTTRDTVANNSLKQLIVFIIDKNLKVIERKVKTGIKDFKYIEIIEGLNLDEKIVTGPNNAINETLKIGDKVFEKK